jgi:CheY-like chemotaxis protein
LPTCFASLFAQKAGLNLVFSISRWQLSCLPVAAENMEKKQMVGKRLLLVEDDRGFREMLKAALSGDAYTVVEANNGAEALGLFRTGRFDLVMVDLEMPFVKGDELAMRIKKLAPRQPILMLTGHDTRPSLKNPVDALLRKPVVLTRLREVMAGLLAGTETRVAA